MIASSFEPINQSFRVDQLYVQEVPDFVSRMEDQKTPMGAMVLVFFAPIDSGRQRVVRDQSRTVQGIRSLISRGIQEGWRRV